MLSLGEMFGSGGCRWHCHQRHGIVRVVGCIAAHDGGVGGREGAGGGCGASWVVWRVKVYPVKGLGAGARRDARGRVGDNAG